MKNKKPKKKVFVSDRAFLNTDKTMQARIFTDLSTDYDGEVLCHISISDCGPTAYLDFCNYGTSASYHKKMMKKLLLLQSQIDAVVDQYQEAYDLGIVKAKQYKAYEDERKGTE